MRRRHLLLAFNILAALAIAATARAGEPGSAGDTTADRVLGQHIFTTNAFNGVDARGLEAPFAVAVDTSVTPNRVYVADTLNSRVLGWADASALANGAPADLVIGQLDFFSNECNRSRAVAAPGRDTLCLPQGLSVDGDGDLWVADTFNHRVLEFQAPFTTDGVADLVFGASHPSPCSEAARESFCRPAHMVVDRAGNLAIADTGHCRILLYRPPLVSDAAPDHVVGTGSCAETCGQGDGLCDPLSLAFDAAGALWIAEFFHVRVLETPFSAGPADGRFAVRAAHDCHLRPVSAENPCSLQGIALDAAGTLWAAALNFHHVLGFDAPLSTDGVAEHVLGVPRPRPLGCQGVTPSAASFCFPRGLAVDGAGRLWVADLGNSRVLRFDAPKTSSTASRVLGQTRFRTNAQNLLDAGSLLSPSGIAVDRSVSPNRLWVADRDYNRVLGWRDAAGFANGAQADLIVGQPDPFTTGCNTGGVSARSLCGPQGVAVDRHGDLWVVDRFNHRVLAFRSPFTTDRVADFVIGQFGSFTASGAACATGRSAATLCQPLDVAVDSRGDVYVADTGRVLAYRVPLATDALADRVLGQPSFAEVDCVTGRVCGPSGLAFDADDTLWVADADGSRVLAYRDPLRTDIRPDLVVGQGGSFQRDECRGGTTGLCGPVDVAVSADGALYVADFRNSRVVRLDAPWRRPRASLVFGLGSDISADSLWSPWSVAVDEDGNLYVADPDHHRLLAYDRP